MELLAKHTPELGVHTAFFGETFPAVSETSPAVIEMAPVVIAAAVWVVESEELTTTAGRWESLSPLMDTAETAGKLDETSAPPWGRVSALSRSAATIRGFELAIGHGQIDVPAGLGGGAGLAVAVVLFRGSNHRRLAFDCGLS
jgi:hypothetical protein